jgi:hypothetical protein
MQPVRPADAAVGGGCAGIERGVWCRTLLPARHGDEGAILMKAHPWCAPGSAGGSACPAGLRRSWHPPARAGTPARRQPESGISVFSADTGQESVRRRHQEPRALHSPQTVTHRLANTIGVDP